VAVRLTRSSSPATSWELAYAPPHPVLRGQFGQYCGYAEDSAPAAQRQVPHGGVTVIINLGPDLLVDGQPYPSFVAGLHDRPVWTEHPGGQAGIQVDLTPLGAYTLLGRPAGELGNTIVHLGELFGRGTGALVDRLRETPDWAGRFALLDEVLAGRLDTGPRPAPEVAWAWRELTRTEGRISVAALTAGTGWSHRHLVSRFRQQVGMAPKAYGRVLRFERAVRLLSAPARPRFADLAAACGYYDQAHLNRDFRDLAGITPSQMEGQVRFFQDPTEAAA
jgi:AraC-like DNA-binding protein